MSTPTPALDADLLLVGGGLANGLLAWRLRQQRPDLRVLLLEREGALGGNHTWSFHDDDLSTAQRQWIAPLVGWSWDGYEVRFPAGARRFAGGYASIESDRFHAVLGEALGASVRLDCRVRHLAPTQLVLEDGSVLRARAVVDGRGQPPREHLQLGWQAFVGQVLRFDAPHGLRQPVLMDATVPQDGGYRFMYLLPFDGHTLLAEDTCYCDGQRLDAEDARGRIAAYARRHGWHNARILREEQGVLPIALGGDPEGAWAGAGGVPRHGLAAGLFHPTTGYSLPEAVRTADLVASLPAIDAPALFAALRAHALRRWHAQGFYRMLNRMLFRAAAPQERWRVLQRFYGLSPGLIRRFYAGRTHLADKARLVVGRPPVPFFDGCRAAFDLPLRHHREMRP